MSYTAQEVIGKHPHLDALKQVCSETRVPQRQFLATLWKLILNIEVNELEEYCFKVVLKKLSEKVGSNGLKKLHDIIEEVIGE